MKAWRIDNKSIDKLADRLDRLEANNNNNAATNEDLDELEKLSPMEKYELNFNWYVREIMPYYKAEVMRLHNITSDEEYSRRVLEGDQSIYLPQPNRKFEPTSYEKRVAHVLGLDYKGLQNKIATGDIKVKIAIGLAGNNWRDEDPNAVF